MFNDCKIIFCANHHERILFKQLWKQVLLINLIIIMNVPIKIETMGKKSKSPTFPYVRMYTIKTITKIRFAMLNPK